MPVSIIFDTDMDTDCDDAGALAMLHALAGNGEAALLGVICDVPVPWCAPCVRAINAFYGRPEIPVGAVPMHDFETAARYDLYRKHLLLMAQGRVYEPYNRAVALNFLPQEEAVRPVEDGAALYRRLLSGQPDGSVVIAAVGLLSALQQLLDSAPDEYSPLDGRALVQAKVKMLVTMGSGSFPAGRDGFNWWMDKGAAAAVLNHWPAPLAVSEWGAQILTGASLTHQTPPTNPVRHAYEIYLHGPGRSRCSWDQVAVLYAVRGAGDNFSEIGGHRLRFAAQSGEHQWCREAGGAPHIYLQQAASDAVLAAIIEDLMIQAPR